MSFITNYSTSKPSRQNWPDPTAGQTRLLSGWKESFFSLKIFRQNWLFCRSRVVPRSAQAGGQQSVSGDPWERKTLCWHSATNSHLLDLTGDYTLHLRAVFCLSLSLSSSLAPSSSTTTWAWCSAPSVSPPLSQSWSSSSGRSQTSVSTMTTIPR